MILGYLRQNPGANYTTIKRDLGLHNGTLTYNLRFLEKERKIKSISDGRLKRFYLTRTHIPSVVGIKGEIIDILKEFPGSDRKLIARILRIHPRTAGKYLSELELMGKIRSEKDGKDTVYFAVPVNHGAFEKSLTTDKAPLNRSD